MIAFILSFFLKAVPLRIRASVEEELTRDAALPPAGRIEELSRTEPSPGRTHAGAVMVAQQGV